MSRSEIPPWRLELSRRLREIKMKREAAGELPSADGPDDVPQPAARKRSQLEQRRPASSRFAIPRRRRTSGVAEDSGSGAVDTTGSPPQAPPAIIPPEESRTSEDTNIPLPAEDVLLHSWQSTPTSTDREDIQKLIDSVMAQQAGLERTAPSPIDIEVRSTGMDASIAEEVGPIPGIAPEAVEAEAPPAAPQIDLPESKADLMAAMPQPAASAVETAVPSWVGAVVPEPEYVAPQVETVVVPPEIPIPPTEVAAAIPEAALPEPEYVARQVETVAAPPDIPIPPTEAVAAIPAASLPEPEYVARQVETVAAPPDIPIPPTEVVAAIPEAPLPEPEYVSSPADTAAEPPEIPVPPTKVVAAVPEAPLPEPEHISSPADTAAEPPEIPVPPAEVVAAVPEAASPELARDRPRTETAPRPSTTPPATPKEASRETAKPALEVFAHRTASAAFPKQPASSPAGRAAQAPGIAQQPKIVMSSQTPSTPPPPRIGAPARVAPAPEPKAASPAARTTAPVTEPAIFRHVVDAPQESKLILLTRTLAGLVDLIIIFVSGSAFIFMVDILEGISVFDDVSVTHYLLLLLLTYFVYSMFFLCTGTQTIGMMLTYLRVTGTDVNRPKVSQMLLRCIVFLLGLAAFGIGLLWGFFDRQARCLHDRLSRTKVDRISS